MVSWSRAYLLALKAVIYSVLWMIVGGALILAGAGLVGLKLTPVATARQPMISGIRGLVGLALIVVGAFILLFGSLASVIKVAVDEAERLRYSPPP